MKALERCQDLVLDLFGYTILQWLPAVGHAALPAEPPLLLKWRCHP